MQVNPRKSDIVSYIASMLGVEAPAMSTGSTEPREIFVLINEYCGLGITYGLTKPNLARAIVELSGSPWLATYESRGGTVTRDGLLAVQHAVEFFLAKGPCDSSQ